MRNLLVKTFIISSFLVVLPAQAELKNCNGVWTNKDCEGKTTREIKESTVKERDPAEVQNKEKKFWISDLELKALRAKKEHDIDIDTGDVEVLCQKPETRSRSVELLWLRGKMISRKGSWKPRT